MSKKQRGNLFKLLLGIAISGLFLYFAFSKIDLSKMAEAFRSANYWLLIPATFMMFFSHWLRAIRWQLFLNSIKKIPLVKLFSATLIGYMGNTILPAHLGEFIRANVIGRNEKIPTSSVFATILIERIIDVLSLLVIMLIAVIAYPFPQWVTNSGYIMFAVVVGLFICLYLLKLQNPAVVALLNFCLKLLPKKLAAKIEEMITAFIEGINGMQRKREYVILFVLSIAIWSCYWAIYHILLYSFNLVDLYQVGVLSSIVLLVITTIAVVVPSSPGYVGTFHFLCQFSLGLFGVPGSIGLSFAIVAHAITNIPVALVGFALLWREGISRLNTKELAAN